jgi:putative transposase
MQHNAAGAAVLTVWHQLPQQFSEIALDEAILMPDHFHGILWIAQDTSMQPVMRPAKRTADGSLGRCLQAWKLPTTTYIQDMREQGWNLSKGGCGSVTMY